MFVPLRMLPIEDPLAEFVFAAVVVLVTEGVALDAVSAAGTEETFFWLNLSSSFPKLIDEA